MISEIILTNLGLSPNEANIYLAALESGQASAQRIAQKAKIKRTTAYSVLEGMVKKGFILKTNKEGHHQYLAENPKSLAERFKTYQKSFENVLPELEAIHNKRDIKPKVLFFEDEDGIKKIYEDTIKEKPQEILEFNTSEMQRAFPDLPKKYLEQRKLNNITAMRITPADNFWKSHKQADQEELSETKLIKDFNIPVEINIYNNKVAFMSYADKIGLIIESEGIANSMKQIYELLWKKI
ncbi:MAG: helix-turn-helix domain-containing protein [Parcubacteria group bacterium]|jgi:sugar-specific transcriptional regulator TrmB